MRAADDELAPVDSNEAYKAVGKAMCYDVLGCAPDADVADFREDPGTLEQRRWKKLEWSAPADETTPCWWLVNPRDEITNSPRLLSRSVVCLRLELNATRYATSSKAMFNLHRKGLPLHALEEKAAEYVNAKLLTADGALKILKVLEAERSVYRMCNEAGVADDGGTAVPALTHRLSPEQMVAELADREAKMQAGAQAGGITDQWRVYQYITGCIQTGQFLRLMVQASAGTGKSFLLTTVFLWCIVNNKKAKAAAPTGIAAANVEIEGTDVCASTIHTIFDLDTEYKTKLDLAHMNNIKVLALMEMEVLLLDEVSMIDTACWSTISDLLSIIDHNRRPNANARHEDPFGQMHVVLFGDFKQLPPATSKAPFIVDPSVTRCFTFRVLRENRRVCRDATRAQELEEFHQVLTDISRGRVTTAVRDFSVQAYVRGAQVG